MQSNNNNAGSASGRPPFLAGYSSPKGFHVVDLNRVPRRRLESQLDRHLLLRAEELRQHLIAFDPVLMGRTLDAAAWDEVFRRSAHPERKLEAFRQLLDACRSFASRHTATSHQTIAYAALLLSLGVLDVNAHLRDESVPVLNEVELDELHDLLKTVRDAHTRASNGARV